MKKGRKLGDSVLFALEVSIAVRFLAAALWTSNECAAVAYVVDVVSIAVRVC